MRRALALLLLVGALPATPARSGAPAPGPAPAPVAERAADLRVEYRLPYAGGTELATDGRYVYAGQYNGRTERDEFPRQGGVRIFDTQTSPARHVGTIRCAGTDMDVAVVRPGVLAVAHHRSQCGVRSNGITIFDVSNPAKPRQAGSIKLPSAHTLTAVPGTNYVYVSPGGSGYSVPHTHVVDVTDPRQPRLAKSLRPDEYGCHDVTFGTTLSGRRLGVCTGMGGVRIWDLTNPLAPKSMAAWAAREPGRNHQIQFPHGSAISPDGMLLVVNDEAFFNHRCDGKDEAGAGSLHLYDILDPTRPRYLGRIEPPRGRYAASSFGRVGTWCTSHQLNFMPNSRRLVNAWFTGGFSVWDLTVPELPREEAFAMERDSLTWTAHWLGEHIWVNDMRRGLTVMSMSLLPAGPLEVSPAWRPAGTEPTVITWPTRPPSKLVCPF